MSKAISIRFKLVSSVLWLIVFVGCIVGNIYDYKILATVATGLLALGALVSAIEEAAERS